MSCQYIHKFTWCMNHILMKVHPWQVTWWRPTKSVKASLFINLVILVIVWMAPTIHDEFFCFLIYPSFNYMQNEKLQACWTLLPPLIYFPYLNVILVWCVIESHMYKPKVFIQGGGMNQRIDHFSVSNTNNGCQCKCDPIS